MDSSSLLAVVGVLEAEGISVWLDGGWGVDALLGYQTRDHDDLDVVVELNNATRIIELRSVQGTKRSRSVSTEGAVSPPITS
jgi:lincosamide nucleotidyltransferase A/C/D/E